TGSSAGPSDLNPSIYLVTNSTATATQGLVAGHIVGNFFENGPSAIWISPMHGGEISDNWFQAEAGNGNALQSSTGTWIGIVGSGVTIAHNHFNCGNFGIASPDGLLNPATIQGGSVRDNEMLNLFGTSISVVGDAVIEGNAFGAPTVLNGAT